MSGRESYHHGDLRKALLDAALEIVAESGLDALGLRAVAARAGVSHAAPAHHFPTLKHLLTALAAIAFERLRATLLEDIARAPGDVRGMLAGAGDGYVRFSRENPHLFRLMFSASQLNWDDPNLQESARGAYAPLADTCVRVAQARDEASPEAQRRLELLVWSCVLGYAHLQRAGQLHDRPARPDLESLLLG